MNKPEFNPIKQFKRNPLSRAAAVKAKCAECVGCTPEHLESGFQRSISACTSYSCPLYTFRPYQAKKGASSAKKSPLGGVQ